MKFLIFTLFFFLSNSCDTKNQETHDTTSENTIESSTQESVDSTSSYEQNMNPGEITIRLKLVEVFDSGKQICGNTENNVMKMEVQEVLQKGSSIVNLPQNKDQVLMNFFLAPKDLSINNLIEAKAKESLCSNASKTYFTIISYKIVE